MFAICCVSSYLNFIIKSCFLANRNKLVKSIKLFRFRFLFWLNSGVKSNKRVKWTNLNPSTLLDEIKGLLVSFPFKTLEDYMKRAGITNGYQSKPCLNPADPECPETAPNKQSQQVKPVDCSLETNSIKFYKIIEEQKTNNIKVFSLQRTSQI